MCNSQSIDISELILLFDFLVFQLSLIYNLQEVLTIFIYFWQAKAAEAKEKREMKAEEQKAEQNSEQNDEKVNLIKI